VINPRLRELASLISAKDSKEDKKFKDFLNSPYFNKSSKTQRFCLYLLECAQNGTFEHMTEKSISEHVFGGEAVNLKKFGALCTVARRLFEEFLTLCEFEKHEALMTNLLLESLNSKGAGKNFRSVYSQLENKMRKKTYHDQNYFLQRILTQRVLIENEGVDYEKDLSKDYYRLSEYIDKHFTLAKLELVNSLLSRKYHVLGKERADISMLKEAIDYVEANRDYLRKNEAAIFSEYLILKMMYSDENEKYFHELFEYVSVNYKKFPKDGLELVYYPLINYGSNRAALGDSIFLNYVFRIYQSFEKNGFYTGLKAMQDLDFISIIIISLRVGKIRWAENFHSRYLSKLPPDSRKDNDSLSRGLIEFSRRNYDAAIKHIAKVNYRNSYYYLKSKETLMKIYYETDDMEALLPLIDSTRHYLNRRKELLSIHYERYIEFLKCVNLLARIKQKDSDDAYLLRDELKRKRNIISSDWLMEKLSEQEEK
jgi:hypothetical protein